MKTTSFDPILFAFLLGLLVVAFSSKQQRPIKALLITGGGWHDYETQQDLLIDGIEERLPGQVEWTIVHEGEGEPNHHVSVMQEENWTEGYDVIVHNTGFGRVTDADFVAHLVKHHEGTPAVLIHASVHSYRYAEPAAPWFEFMGLQSMAHESRRIFDVENVAPEHPIMEGLPEAWTVPSDELYIIEKVWSDITPLARAYGIETEAYHTVTWTHIIEDTRIFATTLGHSNEAFENDEFLDLLTNGLLWVVQRS